MTEPFVTRGFSGRPRAAGDAKGRIPPGQHEVKDFPVLSAGPTPRVDLTKWELALSGLVRAPAPSAFENIALAHREIYALYEIAQSMGTCLSVSDTMALISTKISKIVPWSGCALFLHDADSHLLKCRFAVGAESQRLLNATVGDDCGIFGAVVGQRQTTIAGPDAVPDSVGLDTSCALQSAIVCPLIYNDTLIGVSASITRSRIATPRITAACSSASPNRPGR